MSAPDRDQDPISQAQALKATGPELAHVVQDLYAARDRSELEQRLQQIPDLGLPRTDRWWGSHQLLVRLRLRADEDAAVLRALEPLNLTILPALVGHHAAGTHAVLITRFAGPWPPDRAPVAVDAPPSPAALDAFWQELLDLAGYNVGYPDLPSGVHRHPAAPGGEERLVLPFWHRLHAIGDDAALDAYLSDAADRLQQPERWGQ